MAKNSRTTITRRLDNLARKICKLNADYTCQRCGWQGDSSTIEWAHIEKRSKKAIRWSQMNCLALCNANNTNCHYWFDNNRVYAMKWLETKFPVKHAWLLEEEDGTPRSQMLFTTSTADLLDLEQELKQTLKELE